VEEPVGREVHVGEDRVILHQGGIHLGRFLEDAGCLLEERLRTEPGLACLDEEVSGPRGKRAINLLALMHHQAEWFPAGLTKVRGNRERRIFRVAPLARGCWNEILSETRVEEVMGGR